MFVCINVRAINGLPSGTIKFASDSIVSVVVTALRSSSSSPEKVEILRSVSGE